MGKISKFLFFSPHALVDSSSGAAKCVQTLLEELAALGHTCVVVSGPIVDGQSHLFEQVARAPALQAFRIDEADMTVPLRKVNFNGIDHLIIGAQATRAQDFLAYEELVLQELFIEIFDTLQPDVLLTFGGFASNFFAGQYALMRGRRSVLFAASDSYNQPADFVHVNMVASISKALTAKLAAVTGLPIVTLKSLVRRHDALSANRTQEFITFINPTPAKGLKLAVAIALACQQRGKPYRFMFVESRGTRASAMRDCPELAACTNITFVQNTSNAAAIYEHARLILYPSVWYETAGRVLLEATENDIPVLASNVGGIAEMLDGAGYLFDPPHEMLNDWLAPPPPEYLAQWLAVLDRLHDDPEEAQNAVNRAKESRARYSVIELVHRFAEATAP